MCDSVGGFRGAWLILLRGGFVDSGRRHSDGWGLHVYMNLSWLLCLHGKLQTGSGLSGFLEAMLSAMSRLTRLHSSMGKNGGFGSRETNMWPVIIEGVRKPIYDWIIPAVFSSAWFFFWRDMVIVVPIVITIIPISVEYSHKLLSCHSLFTKTNKLIKNRLSAGLSKFTTKLSHQTHGCWWQITTISKLHSLGPS